MIMKMYRILISILVVGFAFNICSCGLMSNDNTPHLEEKYIVDFGEDTLESVIPYKFGVIVALDSGELSAIDETGSVMASVEVTEQITHLYSSNDGKILIAFDDKVTEYSVEDGVFVEQTSVDFDSHIQNMTSMGSDDVNLVLLDNGQVYGYGRNFRRMLDDRKGEEAFISEPVLMAENIRDIASRFLVNDDNCVVDILNNEISDPCDEEILGIELSGSPIVYTKDSIYEYIFTNNTFSKVNTIDPECFWCAESGYMYRLNGEYFYTGFLSATPRGKGLPEADNSLVEIPADMSYCVINEGIVCYDSHSLTCYSV